MADAVEQIVAAVDRWQAESEDPLVVAIDGHGAAGKTTIAADVASALDAIVVHTDDYLLEVDDIAVLHPRPMARYYAWEALREDALEPLIARLQDPESSSESLPVIIIEGVSSAAPALADLVARAVFVQTPEPVRLRRLHGRITDEEWDEEWLYTERLYFASRPPDSFDLIVSGAD